MNYEEAVKYSLSIPWKLDVCNVGEKCWCRLILPTEVIKYTQKYSTGEEETEREIEIMPDGSIDKETAEYFVDLHNEKLKRDKIVFEGILKVKDYGEVNIKKELEALDRNDFTAVCELVDRLVFNLSDLLIDEDRPHVLGDEVMLAAAKDYMINLINPELLDFNSK